MHFEVHENLVDYDTVCLHGNLASNVWWEPAIEVWQKQGARKKGRLICAEWRGCGKSSGLKSEDELNLKAMAEDYNGLLQSLGILRAGVIGHSTGGLIALYAMRRNPELYSRAVLLDPVGALGVKFGPEMLDVFTTMSQDRNFCQTVMAGTIHGGTKENLLNRIVADAFGVHPLIWHGIARALSQVDFREEAARITQPVLVLHGEHDQILPQADSRALAAMLPHGKFLELTGRGHSCNVENPELFVEHVNKFLFG